MFGKKRLALVVASLVILCFGVGVGLGLLTRSAGATTNQIGIIKIHNPYSFDVRLEVKCDWNRQISKFDFYRKFVLPGKGAYVLVIPKQHSRCQIWPKVLF